VNLRILRCTYWSDSLRKKKRFKDTELSSEITDGIMCYATIDKSKRGLAVPGKGVVMGNT